MASMENTSVKRPIGLIQLPVKKMSCAGERTAGSGTKGRMGQMECVEEVPVPLHLQSLFEKATHKRSKAEQKAIDKPVTEQLPGCAFQGEFDFGKTVSGAPH